MFFPLFLVEKERDSAQSSAGGPLGEGGETLRRVVPRLSSKEGRDSAQSSAAPLLGEEDDSAQSSAAPLLEEGRRLCAEQCRASPRREEETLRRAVLRFSSKKGRRDSAQSSAALPP